MPLSADARDTYGNTTIAHLWRSTAHSIRQFSSLSSQCPVQCLFILLQLSVQCTFRNVLLYARRDSATGRFTPFHTTSRSTSATTTDRLCKKRIVGVSFAHRLSLGSGGRLRCCYGCWIRGRSGVLPGLLLARRSRSWVASMWVSVGGWNHARLLALCHCARPTVVCDRRFKKDRRACVDANQRPRVVEPRQINPSHASRLESLGGRFAKSHRRHSIHHDGRCLDLKMKRLKDFS